MNPEELGRMLEGQKSTTDVRVLTEMLVEEALLRWRSRSERNVEDLSVILIVFPGRG